MTESRKLSIIVVEDNPIYQQLIAKQLESLSSSMCFYTSGEACIDEIDQEPDVIVMDYNLEGKMTGLDTLKAVRRIFPEVYVILFTDQQVIWTQENFRLFGEFDFLEKNDSSFPGLQQKIRTSDTFLQNTSKRSGHSLPTSALTSNE